MLDAILSPGGTLIHTQCRRTHIPFDIITILLQLLKTRSDVMSLVLTSKDIYTECARNLLRFPITISDDRQLVSLCEFILRDVSRRATHLRQLYICIPLKLRQTYDEYYVYRDDPDLLGASLLVCVLQKAIQLEDLSIDWCEELLERDNRLVPAVTSLNTLRRLRISSFGLLVCELLEGMHSRLRELEVDICTSDTSAPAFQGDNLPLTHLLGTIHGQRDTLESLAVWFSFVGRYETTQPWCQALRFPRLHSLSLRMPADIDLEFLVRTFPNLRCLDATCAWYSSEAEDDSELSRRDIEDMHNENIGHSRWASLEQVSGDLDGIYALGLTSESIVRMDATCPLDCDHAQRRLHHLLQSHGFTHVLLHFGYLLDDNHGEFAIEDEDDSFMDLLETTMLSEKLSHLALDISLDLQVPDDLLDLLVSRSSRPPYFIALPLTKPHALQEMLLEAFESESRECHNLSFLIIRLDTSLPGRTNNGNYYAINQTQHEQTAHLARASAEHWFEPFMQHPEACAERLASAIPSLIYISLQIKGVPPAFWRIHRAESGGVFQLGAIDQIEGQELIEHEGLQFVARGFEPPWLDYGSDHGTTDSESEGTDSGDYSS